MILERLSLAVNVLLDWFTLVIGTPITKSPWKTVFSTPSNWGAKGKMPPVVGFILNPWEARLTPSPPDGWPTTLELRM